MKSLLYYRLMDQVDTSVSPEPESGDTEEDGGVQHVYWISYLEGMQRVVAFSTDIDVIGTLMKVSLIGSLFPLIQLGFLVFSNFFLKEK